MNSSTCEFMLRASNLFAPAENAVIDALRRLVLRNDIHWGFMLEEGMRHRVLPAIYYTLKRYELLSRVPEEAASKLKEAFDSADAANQRYMGEISAFYKELHRQGIRAVLLKGEILSFSYFPHIAARPFGDCDFLVREKDLGAVEGILGAQGYIQGYGENGGIQPPSKREVFFSRLYMKHVIAYVKYEEQFLYVMEPHHQLFWRDANGKPVFSIPMEDFIQRSVSVKYGDAQAWRLEGEDFLLYMCIDVYEDAHRIEKIRQGTDVELIKFLDLASIIHQGIRWEVFMQRVEEAGASQAAYDSLYGLNELYPLVPEYVLDSLKPLSTRFLNEFGFPEELLGDQPCHYRRSFLDRFFDLSYRLSELEEQTHLCRPTTFQSLRRG